MRCGLFFVLALEACEEPPGAPDVRKAPVSESIHAEPAGRRGFAVRDDYVCGGLGPPSLVIGARILMLDGTPVADEGELRSVLRQKLELERRIGGLTTTDIWVQLLQPGRGLLAEKALLAAVREEGFTEVHLSEPNFGAL
jgi:hypothetical protein